MSSFFIIILYSQGKIELLKAFLAHCKQHFIYIDGIYIKHGSGSYDYSQIYKDLNLSEQAIQSKVLIIQPFQQTLESKDYLATKYDFDYIGELVCSDTCTDCILQSIHYSLAHIFFIPHILCDEKGRSNSMTSIALFIILLSYFTDDVLHIFQQINANHIRISIDKDILRVVYYNSIKEGELNAFGKFYLEFDDSNFLNKESPNFLCFPTICISQVNWATVFNHISALDTNILHYYNIYENSCKLYPKEFLLKRWMDRLTIKRKQRKRSNEGGYAIAEQLNKLNLTNQIRVRLLSMISTNLIYASSDALYKHSNKYMEEKKDTRLIAKIEKQIKCNKSELIEQISKYASSSMFCFVTLWKPMKENVPFSEKEIFVYKEAP